LHPEKIIRGKTGWSGIKFILWQQTFERYEGKSFGGAGSQDYLFFFHSFLWAFAPWSVLTYITIVSRIKNFRTYEWLTAGTFLTMAVMITFSGFKLPHYINIIFPSASVLTAAYLLEKIREQNSVRRLFTVQIAICILCLIVAATINVWAFPLRSWLVIMVMVLLFILSAVIVKALTTSFQKMIGLSILTSTVIFYLLNSNFYPQLLTYQGGNELAFQTRDKISPKNVFFWPSIYNPSFQFYSKELKKDFTDSVLNQDHPVWVLTDRNSRSQIMQRSIPVLQQYSHRDYNIGTMSFKFINPKTRRQTLDTLFLIRVK
jgi:lysylphosphatidylglycerol synthetase-like protein (DUF2156 family)